MGAAAGAGAGDLTVDLDTFIPDFDDGLDDKCEGDAADRARLEKMTELERQEECVDAAFSAPALFAARRRRRSSPARCRTPTPHLSHSLPPRQVLGAV